MINTAENIQKLRKFTEDPDWVLMEGIIREFIEPLTDVTTINKSLGNDEIASEVRGRQITIESLTKFLNQTKIISSKPIATNVTSFK